MLNSPVLTLSHGQKEILTELSDVRTSTPIKLPSISEKIDSPIELKSDNQRNSISSYSDENNENEAIEVLITSFVIDQKEHRTTNTETLMHLLKGNVGAGILAFPYAFSKAGLLFGSIAFWMIGVTTLYCMHQLLRCHQFHRERTSRLKCDFGDIMRFTLETCRWRFAQRHAKVGKFIIDGFIVVTQLGFCSVYFVFVPASIKQVIDFYSTKSPAIQIYQLIMLVFIIGFSFIRSLKVLAPFSLIANVITMGGLCIIMQYVLRSHLPLNELPLVTKPSDWPIFFGSAMFAFEGIALVLPVREKMKEPKAYGGWNGVLNTGMYLVTILYFFVGFFGYIRYGTDAHGSISLNLPNDNKLYQSTKIIYAIAIFLSYNLQFYVPSTLLWPRICRKILHRYNDKAKAKFEYAFRFGLIIFTFAIAAAIPNLGLVISLIGAMASSALAVIFPPICETITFWPNDLGRYKWQLILNIIIILFGFYVFFAGTILSLSNIVACIRQGTQCND